MAKPGPKPKERISQTWSPNLAYAVGLIATDGCLARNASLVDLTSKDREQLENFSKCLGLTAKIGTKRSGMGKEYLHVQFKSVLFYEFLLSIGLTPAKSKTMGELRIPRKYFFDFLRGVSDGDGCFYSYWDPRWRSSFMYYVSFASASKKFIAWLRKRIQSELGIRGHITKAGDYRQLRYAKGDSLKILRKMYQTPDAASLSRKRLKIEQALAIVGERL